MELTTFGAILRFAIELEAEAERRYQRAAADAPPAAREPLLTLGRGRRRRRQSLERARQENVAEMILETVRGLDGDDYQTPPPAAGADLPATARALAELEARSAAFYRAAGRKIGLAEVARLFERLAREGDELGGRVAALGADG